MRILKFISRFLICILCTLSLCLSAHAESNLPVGDVGDYGNWLTESNVQEINKNMLTDASKFQEGFQDNVNNIKSLSSVPIEVKIGLVFMKALSSIDYVLQISLVRFTIMFLFVMYALWVALEAYRMMRDSTDYKKVLYDLFEKGIIIVIWVMILKYGPAKIFTMIMSPILAFSSYISDFILNAVAQTYNVDIPDTCTTIHNFVNESVATKTANGTAELLIAPDAAANIMCLPGRLSMYFYHATGAAFKWFLWGFGHSATAIVMGAICVVIFIKCIFKYAFMTLGVVADLFLTLLMLPFTALAEALPPNTKESSYVGKILNGFLSIFNTKKLSNVISTFINAAIYFVSLAIIIAICAALLEKVVPINQNYSQYELQSAMITILCGCLVLYLAGRADELAKKVGGSIDNSFGETLKNDTKTLWNGTKNVTGKIFKDWLKKK